MTSRRTFLFKVLPVAAGLGAMMGSRALAAPGMLSASDPQAAAMGYQADARNVDKKKYPHHVAGQECGRCQLYTGKPGAATGACPIFGGKLVNAKGWCSAFVAKA